METLEQNYLTSILSIHERRKVGYICKDTWRIDCDRRMETEVFNIFQTSFPQYFLVAGLHISLSDILDKKVDLGEIFFS